MITTNDQLYDGYREEQRQERLEEERCSKIRTLCELAGHPERAGLFIAEGISVAMAGDRLKAAGLRTGPVDAGSVSSAQSQDATFKAEYAAGDFAQNGISQVEYIRSRRMDEGLDSLSGVHGKTVEEVKNSGL